MKAGDTVQLKSGSNKMTISWIKDDVAVVVWWDANKCDVSSTKLHVDVLVKV